jgi:hypothetical protein
MNYDMTQQLRDVQDRVDGNIMLIPLYLRRVRRARFGPEAA